MLWLLLAIILMIVLIFLRVNILITAPIVSIFLCLVSGLDVVDTMASGFMVSFATFAQNNFLIFASSAVFAKVMQDTGMAASIAKGISKVHVCPLSDLWAVSVECEACHICVPLFSFD